MVATGTGVGAGGVRSHHDTAEALRRLGQQVRAQRLEEGLTLRQVAARTGLSTPFLSQVENGLGTPSLTSLFALARGLRTTAEALLAGPAPEPIIVVRADEGPTYPIVEGTDAAQRRQLTSPGEPFSVAEYVVDAGTDLGGFEASEGRDLLHVLEGALRVEVRTGDSVITHELDAGDTILYDTAEPHRWSVVGEHRTRVLHVVSVRR